MKGDRCLRSNHCLFLQIASTFILCIFVWINSQELSVLNEIIAQHQNIVPVEHSFAPKRHPALSKRLLSFGDSPAYISSSKLESNSLTAQSVDLSHLTAGSLAGLFASVDNLTTTIMNADALMAENATTSDLSVRTIATEALSSSVLLARTLVVSNFSMDGVTITNGTVSSLSAAVEVSGTLLATALTTDKFYSGTGISLLDRGLRTNRLSVIGVLTAGNNGVQAEHVDLNDPLAVVTTSSLFVSDSLTASSILASSVTAEQFLTPTAEIDLLSTDAGFRIDSNGRLSASNAVITHDLTSSGVVSGAVTITSSSIVSNSVRFDTLTTDTLTATGGHVITDNMYITSLQCPDLQVDTVMSADSSGVRFTGVPLSLSGIVTPTLTLRSGALTVGGSMSVSSLTSSSTVLVDSWQEDGFSLSSSGAISALQIQTSGFLGSDSGITTQSLETGSLSGGTLSTVTLSVPTLTASELSSPSLTVGGTLTANSGGVSLDQLSVASAITATSLLIPNVMGLSGSQITVSVPLTASELTDSAGFTASSTSFRVAAAAMDRVRAEYAFINVVPRAFNVQSFVGPAFTASQGVLSASTLFVYANLTAGTVTSDYLTIAPLSVSAAGTLSATAFALGALTISGGGISSPVSNVSGELTATALKIGGGSIISTSTGLSTNGAISAAEFATGGVLLDAAGAISATGVTLTSSLTATGLVNSGLTPSSTGFSTVSISASEFSCGAVTLTSGTLSTSEGMFISGSLTVGSFDTNGSGLTASGAGLTAIGTISANGFTNAVMTISNAGEMTVASISVSNTLETESLVVSGVLTADASGLTTSGIISGSAFSVGAVTIQSGILSSVSISSSGDLTTSSLSVSTLTASEIVPAVAASPITFQAPLSVSGTFMTSGALSTPTLTINGIPIGPCYLVSVNFAGVVLSGASAGTQVLVTSTPTASTLLYRPATKQHRFLRWFLRLRSTAIGSSSDWQFVVKVGGVVCTSLRYDMTALGTLGSTRVEVLIMPISVNSVSCVLSLARSACIDPATGLSTPCMASGTATYVFSTATAVSIEYVKDAADCPSFVMKWAFLELLR